MTENNLDLELTVALESDLEQVASLVNSAYRGDTSRAGWTTEADFLAGQRTDAFTLTETLRGHPHRQILVMRKHGVSKNQSGFAGCVYIEQFIGRDHLGCYLGMLTVSPTLQTSGLGRKLMTAAEEKARQAGCRYMTLGVIQFRTELMAWYERRGYNKTGETKPFPYGDPKAGVPLRNDLHFIMFEKVL